MPTLKVYKIHPEVTLPAFSTEQAACFDIAYQNAGKTHFKGHTKENSEFNRVMGKMGKAIIMPGERIQIPTGIILDIPVGYSVRVHARSGLSYRKGLVLANSEGVIDSDYFDELFIMLTNISSNSVSIDNGDRIAQGELVPMLKYNIAATKRPPTKKTNRVGGLGSTGVKPIEDTAEPEIPEPVETPAPTEIVAEKELDKTE